jgi:hypothetical protein
VISEMFAAEAAVEPDDRDTWARALARASSLAARAAWVVVIRVLVVCTKCAEPWNTAVPFFCAWVHLAPFATRNIETSCLFDIVVCPS